LGEVLEKNSGASPIRKDVLEKKEGGRCEARALFKGRKAIGEGDQRIGSSRGKPRRRRGICSWKKRDPLTGGAWGRVRSLKDLQKKVSAVLPGNTLIT